METVDRANVSSASHSRYERTSDEGPREGSSPVERDGSRGGWWSGEKFTREGDGGRCWVIKGGSVRLAVDSPREPGMKCFCGEGVGGGGRRRRRMANKPSLRPRLTQRSVKELNTSQTRGTDDFRPSVSAFSVLALRRFAGRPPCACRRHV